MKALLLVSLIILVSGCTSVATEGLSVTLQANPSRIFSESFSTLHIDLDNHDSKMLSNVVVSAFDTGILKAYNVDNYGNVVYEICSVDVGNIVPYEFRTVSCLLHAPALEESVQTEVNTRVNFNSFLETNQLFEIITENEYQRRVALGNYEQKSRSYTHRDSNVMVEIDFNEPLPLIMTPGKKYFVYFQITNVGPGIVGDIAPGQFLIHTAGDILRCPTEVILTLNGREFPRVACEIVLDRDYLQGKEFVVSDIGTSLAYNYELRNALKIDVLK